MWIIRSAWFISGIWLLILLWEWREGHRLQADPNANVVEEYERKNKGEKKE